MSEQNFTKIRKSVQKSFKQYIKSFSENSKTRGLTFAFLALLLAGSLYLTRSVFFAAFVNGVPVTRLSLIRELEKSAGGEVLDSLVTQKLIYQEAQNKNVEVSDQEVQAELDSISSMLEAQGNSLEAVLGSQNQSIETLKENIRLQKVVEKLLSDKVQVSDEEVSDYFEQNKDYYGEDVNLEDVKEEIKGQLKNQKLNTEFTPFLDNLKTESKIIYLLDFGKNNLPN